MGVIFWQNLISLGIIQFFGIDFDILLMTLYNVVCRAIVFIFFRQIKPILVKKNGNNKRIECLSNDSIVLMSVLLCLCKQFHIVYNCNQFNLVYLWSLLILISFYHCG